MTIHSLDGVLEAERLGFKRVVLSRELTIDEIKYICDNSNIEIEVFIHGALCICYSGQCLLSSMIGARSGNRGKCAQPCRLPYQLIKNSEIIDTGHLLSPKDLCSLELLPTLVNLGITCFKIEGRLKNPEYVSTVTRIYRKYIDLALSDKPYIIDEKDKRDLLQVFNRGGFSKGYLESKPNQQFVCKDKPNNAGIFIGNVYNFNQNKGYITLKLQDNISIGDTVSLENEKGSYTVSELINNNQNIPFAKSGNIVKIGRIKGNISVGDKIFKMSSKDLCNLSNEYMNNEKIKTVINSKIIVQKNTPISMQIYTDYIDSDTIYNNIDFTLTSDLIPVDSINSPITTERIVEQINKLGGKPFEFGKIDVSLGENLYIPSISKLNQLRRDCISKLENILLERIHRKCIIDIDTKFESYKSGKSDKVSENFTLKTIRDTNVSSNEIIKSYKGISILLNTLTINEDGSISSNNNAGNLCPDSPPISVEKNEDGSYLCILKKDTYHDAAHDTDEFGVVSCYTIYPIGIIEDEDLYITKDRESLKNTVYIKYWDYYTTNSLPTRFRLLDEAEDTTEPSSENNSIAQPLITDYAGIDWVETDQLNDSVGSEFISGTGIKYTVIGEETSVNNQRQRLIVESESGDKRMIVNMPAFEMDVSTGIAYYNIFAYESDPNYVEQ